MRKIRNILKNRALLTLLAIVMVWGSLTFVLVPEAHACSPNDVETYYYTDATYTVQCGYRFLACNCGGVYSWGCVTPFKSVQSCPC